MRTICIDGPAKGRTIDTLAPTFRYPVRERPVFESALHETLPTAAPCPTVEYRLERYDAEAILSAKPDEFPGDISLADWSFARLVASGYYDARRRAYVVWQSC